MLSSLQLRRWLVAFGRGLALASGCILLFLLLVCALIVVQGRRDETRPASAALVFDAAGTTPPDAALQTRLDRAIELYRRGTVERVVLIGNQQASAPSSSDYLRQRGMPTTTLVVAPDFAQVAATTRAAGISSLVLVAAPTQQLRVLKISHDLGIEAYGSPTTSPLSLAEQASAVLREALAYTSYLLLGS